MKHLRIYLSLMVALLCAFCNGNKPETSFTTDDTLPSISKADTNSIALKPGDPFVINTKNIPADKVVSFAETLVGTPYKYASTNPVEGFDCSGFITYVFNRFNIQVPRSSIDFTNVGKPVKEQDAARGDIILFTGTNPDEKVVGHMGLIVQTQPELQFIHSSSGKANGVTITPLNDYYRGRFVKIIRVFE